MILNWSRDAARVLTYVLWCFAGRGENYPFMTSECQSPRAYCSDSLVIVILQALVARSPGRNGFQVAIASSGRLRGDSSPAAPRTPVSGRRRPRSAAIISSLSSLSSYRKAGGPYGGQDWRFLLQSAAMELYWQGSSIVECIDGPFAENGGPKVATA